jgi:hypothetical protein
MASKVKRRVMTTRKLARAAAKLPGALLTLGSVAAAAKAREGGKRKSKRR